MEECTRSRNFKAEIPKFLIVPFTENICVNSNSACLLVTVMTDSGTAACRAAAAVFVHPRCYYNRTTT